MKTWEYKNICNDGFEKVFKIDDVFYVASDWGNGSFCTKQRVDAKTLKNLLLLTKAPSYVVQEIFND